MAIRSSEVFILRANLWLRPELSYEDDSRWDLYSEEAHPSGKMGNLEMSRVK